MPVVRKIPWLQYSPETDISRRTENLRAVFPHLYTDDDAIEYQRTYLMAMSARVGSTALAHWLQASGLSDNPIQEIFNNRGMTLDLANKWGVSSLCQYVNSSAKLCGQGRLIFKVGWWDMAPLLRLIEGNIDTWFPNASWVYIERKDKVAQAYSLWKASEYGIWHVKQGQTYKSPVSKAIPIDRMRVRIAQIEKENEYWKRFFDDNGIVPHCIYYEDFLSDPHTAMTNAFTAFTGNEVSSDSECPMLRTTDESDLKNVEFLRSKLSARRRLLQAGN